MTTISTTTTIAPMNEAQACQYLGLSIHTVRQWRHLGKGPLYVKVGRAVRYRQADLDAYMQSRTVAPQA